MSCLQLVLSYLDQLVYESQVAADFPGMAAGRVSLFHLAVTFSQNLLEHKSFIASLPNSHFLRKQPSNIRGKIFLHY